MIRSCGTLSRVMALSLAFVQACSDPTEDPAGSAGSHSGGEGSGGKASTPKGGGGSGAGIVGLGGGDGAGGTEQKPYDFTLVESDVDGVLAPEGFKVEVFAKDLERPLGLSFSNGSLVVGSDCYQPDIYCPVLRFDLEGHLLDQTVDVADPDGILLDPNGDLIVAGQHEVSRVKFDGSEPELIADGFKNLNFVIFDADGKLLVQESGGPGENPEASIFRMNADGTEQEIFYTPGTGGGLVLEPDGSILAAGSLYYGDIVRITGAETSEVFVTIPKEDEPFGISRIPDQSDLIPGALVVTLLTRGKVALIDPSRNLHVVLAGLDGIVDGQEVPYGNGPGCTATAPDGSFFVTEISKGRVLRVFPPEARIF